MNSSHLSHFLKPIKPVDECSNERETHVQKTIFFYLNNNRDEILHEHNIKFGIGIMLREIYLQSGSR